MVTAVTYNGTYAQLRIRPPCAQSSEAFRVTFSIAKGGNFSLVRKQVLTVLAEVLQQQPPYRSAISSNQEADNTFNKSKVHRLGHGGDCRLMKFAKVFLILKHSHTARMEVAFRLTDGDQAESGPQPVSRLVCRDIFMDDW